MKKIIENHANLLLKKEYNKLYKECESLKYKNQELRETLEDSFEEIAYLMSKINRLEDRK